MKSIYIAASFLVTLAAPLTASSASFDCSKAGRPTEKMICADPELSLLDENISATYKKLLAKNPDIKSAQIEWIKETRKCESSSAPSDCLKDQYKNRLADLNRELNAEQTQSVPTASTESEKSAPVIPEPSQPKSPTEVKTESKESGGFGLLYILLAIGGIAAAFYFWKKKNTSSSASVNGGSPPIMQNAPAAAEKIIPAKPAVSTKNDIPQPQKTVPTQNTPSTAKEQENLMKADKFTYIVIAQVQSEEGWGANLQGVGGSPLYMFEESGSDNVFAFTGSEVSKKTLLKTEDDKWGEIIGQYIETKGLDDFNKVTGNDVSESYLRELISAALDKAGEGSDFEYENGVSLTLLDGESELMNGDALDAHVGKYGIWIMVREDLDISYDGGNKLTIDGEEIQDLGEAASTILFSNGEMHAVLLNT